MSSSSRKSAQDEREAKRAARYGRYFGLVSLGMAPLVAALLVLRHDWLDRLPEALQWILLALALVSTLYLLGLFVLPWSRPFWLRSNFYDPRHWWGFLLPMLNTFYVVAMATSGFAVVSGLLYLQGVAGTAPERALDDPFNDAFGYYMWSFLNAIPVLELPQTFGWEPPLRFTDRANSVLLLVYKVALISPVIATGTLIWQDVRRLRSGAKA